MTRWIWITDQTLHILDDSSMHFVEDDIHLGDDVASNQPSLSIVSTNFSASFDDLKASISQLIPTQKKDTRRIDDAQKDILSKLNTLEKDILEALKQHEEANKSMMQSARQEARTQKNVLSINLNEFRKVFQGHSDFVTSDLADVRKEHKAQRAMLEELGFLVDYINRGGDAKKGEGGSIRPQPPPDDQNRPGGGSGSRPIHIERLFKVQYSNSKNITVQAIIENTFESSSGSPC
ncbi:hypothetical protein F511_40170 [Dorcoceras hygrometricum]|uniref:Uncharacterized protein n=1 Tax=Dorcoceras hygrometricum TaxID=472368 RepID=A0A2Z7BWJ5_9LAMI|nr:hypothetical protein F511_40170 [Dorcoceras hygrometricum]